MRVGTDAVNIMAATKAKRARKANFSKEEIFSLLEEMNHNKHILLATHGTEVTNSKKNEVWKSIATKLSSFGVSERDVGDCKDKWKSIKADTLKRLADQKKTGGGPPAPPGPFDELVLAIIGEESAVVEGLQATVPDVHQAAMKVPEGASSETLFVSIEENPVLSSSASVIISEHDVGQRPDTPGVREEAGRITPTSSQRGFKRPRHRHSSDTWPALDITADERAFFNVQTRLGHAVLDDVMPLVPMLYNVLQAQQRVLELKAQKLELEIRNLRK